MEKLDRKTYKDSILRRKFSEADELIASRKSPLHPRKVAATMQCLRFCVKAVLNENKPPEPWNWAEVIDAANVVEVFIELGFIEDPDGLHALLQDSLVRGGRAHMQNNTQVLRLDAGGAGAIDEFVDGFESLLGSLPERKVVRALRTCHERMRHIDKGELRAGDFVVEVHV